MRFMLLLCTCLAPRVSAAGVGARPRCLLLGTTQPRTSSPLPCMLTRAKSFQSKHTAGTTAYTVLTEMLSLTEAPPTPGLNRLALICCMELIVSTLPLNWGCCRMGNYCSLGWAICCLLQQALLCESADERVMCKLQLCLCVYVFTYTACICLHLCVVWGWWAWNTWPIPGKQRLLIVFSIWST